MAPAPGTRLGIYEIIPATGSGGMVEYRARDKKLDRDVAIKFQPEAEPNSAAISPDGRIVVFSGMRGAETFGVHEVRRRAVMDVLGEVSRPS